MMILSASWVFQDVIELSFLFSTDKSMHIFLFVLELELEVFFQILVQA